jgi:hypothetical protein
MQQITFVPIHDITCCCNNNNYYSNIGYFRLLLEPLVIVNLKCQKTLNLGNETTKTTTNLETQMTKTTLHPKS